MSLSASYSEINGRLFQLQQNNLLRQYHDLQPEWKDKERNIKIYYSTNQIGYSIQVIMVDKPIKNLSCCLLLNLSCLILRYTVLDKFVWDKFYSYFSLHVKKDPLQCSTG